MKHFLDSVIVAALLATQLFASMGCGQPHSTSFEAALPVAPITVAGDLTSIDVCSAIPREDIEAVMGRKLSVAPKRFEYYDDAGTSGCWYEAAKDSSGEAHFGYVVVTPVAVYANQPLHLKQDVSGLGDEAYFNNGADARQLWVKIDNKVAFVVAFGDVPKEAGCRSLAKLVANAIR